MLCRVSSCFDRGKLVNFRPWFLVEPRKPQIVQQFNDTGRKEKLKTNRASRSVQIPRGKTYVLRVQFYSLHQHTASDIVVHTGSLST